MRRTAAVLALATLAGCNKPAPPPPPPPGPPPIDEAAAKQGVDALWARSVTADTSGNVDSFMTLFTADARLDIQGLPAMVGKAEIDKTVRPVFAMRKATAYTPVAHTTTVVSNDLVYQGGAYTETYVEKQKSHAEHGRFITARVKGADGQWRVAYYMAIIDSTVAAR